MISLITACSRPEFLPELAESIAVQAVDLEWVVQLDGAAREQQAEVLRTLEKYEFAKPRSNDGVGGPSLTRNAALIRSSGDQVMCIDDDDLLYSGAVSALHDALGAWPQAFAAWGQTRSFSDDPTQSTHFKAWDASGLIRAGTIGEQFVLTGSIPTHVGSCLWRREFLVAMGGYTALERSIDTSPFLACEAIWPTVYVDEPVYLYRHHADQMTNSRSYRNQQQSVHGFVNERARSLAAVVDGHARQLGETTRRESSPTTGGVEATTP